MSYNTIHFEINFQFFQNVFNQNQIMKKLKINNLNHHNICFSNIQNKQCLF